MASTIATVTSRIYSGLGTTLLASWTVTALGFAALDVLSADRSVVQPIASISLFTFLAARLVVSVSKARGRPQEDTIAHLVASAHYGSRPGAFVVFALSWTWLYQLLIKGFLLLAATFIGGGVAAIIYNDGLNQQSDLGDTYDGVPNDPSEKALVEINEFKEQVGLDPTELFRRIPPRLLVYLAMMVWANHLSLGLYVLGHTARSTLKVLTSSSSSESKVTTVADKTENLEKTG